VHFFLPASYLVGGPLALLARMPNLVMSRRSLNLYQRKRPLVSRLERWLHKRMDAILGNSGAVVRELIEVEGCPPNRVGLIHNGIDTTAFSGQPDKAAIRAELDIDPKSFVAIIVANLIPYKGHGDLLDALSRVRDRLPQPWTLLCVGRDDGILPQLEDLARAQGIADRVRFLGERKDVPRLLAAGDIGLLCSHQEGFSNAILEGMAAGLPMVVTDVGGNGEAVADGETGFVVPARDAGALSEAIVKLASEPSLRAKQGKKARARVEAQFSIQTCVSKYDRLYSALLAGEAVSDLEGIRAADYGFQRPICAESAVSSTP
jgi:glycosyltransferase involved in cell wall biosynthesis